LKGFIYNGRTMVSAREVLTILNIPYGWDAGTNSVVLGFYKIPAMIVSGMGYVQIKEIAAAIDRQVGWDANSRTATII